MRVDVYPTVLNIPSPEDLAGRIAVVIDVLRATSTILTALANGAEAVVPFLTPEEAFETARKEPGRRFVLGGERNAVRISGFDLGNSPLEYTPERVAGRPVLLTTTNGTRAIRQASEAEALLTASFLNAPAVARELHRLGKDVAICCAGTRGQFSLEDTACAGAILAALREMRNGLVTNDLGHVAAELYRRHEGRMLDVLRRSEHGQNLFSLGLEADLIYCSQFGTFDLIPRLREGQITLGKCA